MNIRGTLWIVAICYTIPLNSLLLIYARILFFLRHQSINSTVLVRQRQQRDLAITQRIFISAGILSGLRFPRLIVVLLSFITGVEYPLSHRITLTGIEISLALLSVEMIIVTPQLRRWQGNRITAFEDIIQMRRSVPAL